MQKINYGLAEKRLHYMIQSKLQNDEAVIIPVMISIIAFIITCLLTINCRDDLFNCNCCFIIFLH